MEYEKIEAMNWSSLKNMATSALFYDWRTKHPRPDSPSFALGRAVHCAVLEPDFFDERFGVLGSDVNLRTKDGRKKRDEMIESGFQILKADDVEIVERCRQSVLNHSYASDSLKNTDREQIVTWIDPITGTPCKGRLDAVNSARIIELKTTNNLSKFSRDVASFLYHGQAAWYMDGSIEAGIVSNVAKFLFIVVETKEPFDCALFVLPDYVLEAGRRLYRSLLSMWVECKSADIWPGRYPAPEPLELPGWAPGMNDGGDLL